MSQDSKRQITNRALKVGSKRVWAAIKKIMTWRIPCWNETPEELM